MYAILSLLLAPLALAMPAETTPNLLPRQFAIAPPGVSVDGKCGSNSAGGNVTCVGSAFGDCCSMGGYCGRGTAYCGEGLCQSGKCSKSPTPGTLYTKDGKCGVQNGGALCGDLIWGPCCSNYGFCGQDEAHCAAGMCQGGACKADGPASGGLSIDGHCGPNFPGNKTCEGTTFGNCCSNYGFCGTGADYCAKAVCFSGKCNA